MTPRQFEARYEPVLGRARARPGRARQAARREPQAAPAQARRVPDRRPTPCRARARVAQLYRQCCEHLALARERAYPVHLVARLETLTARAHQRIYRRHDFGLGALRDLVLYEAPAAVRALRWHLLVVALVFVLPIVVVGIATWIDPHFVLTVVDAKRGAHVRRHVRPGGGRAPGPHVRRRLADVRLLHHAQRRHLVPVLRRRPDRWASAAW